jgi:hypothetical protein
MSLKGLLAGEMIQVSTPWLTPADAAYLIFQRTSQLTGLQPEMQKAHDAIFAFRAKPEDPRIQRLSDEAAALDAKHDAQAKGIHAALTMLSMVSNPADTFTRLLDLLLPDGLEHIKRTHREEAGHAALVASKLDDQTKAELKAITIHDLNMLDMVQGWFGTAKQLGEIEEVRVRLANTGSGSGSAIHQARMRWIRTVNAIQAVAAMSDLDEESDAILFSALRAAERTADNRGRSSTTASATAEPAATASTSASGAGNGSTASTGG